MRRHLKCIMGMVTAIFVMLAFAPAAKAAEVTTGTLSGHITKSESGDVQVQLFTSSGFSYRSTFSNRRTGNYEFTNVAAGDYKLRFNFQGRTQWAHQKLSFEEAATFSVVAGQETVVDETLLEPGSIEVVATDAITGEPVDGYCVDTTDTPVPRYCGAENGTLRLTGLGAQTYQLYVRSTDGLYFRQRVDDVAVAFSQVTRVEVTLEPAAVITTTVVDRQTGQPVYDTCVAALPLKFGALDDQTCRWDVNHSDEAGRVTLGELQPGTYTLLAIPSSHRCWPDPCNYGIQWVGRKGGVGSQYKAFQVNAVAGQITAVDPVQLDPAAAISGTIRDQATQEPIAHNGCASILPTRNGTTVPLGVRNCTDANGRYTLDKLGPYKWPILFSHFYDHSYDYGKIWSGDARDRRGARPVPAGIGQPTTADVDLALEQGGLTGTVHDTNGQPHFGSLNFELYNDRTGDLVKQAYTYGSSYQIQGITDQPVRIFYAPGYPREVSWYGGTDFESATPVRIIPKKLTTVDLTVSAMPS